MTDTKEPEHVTRARERLAARAYKDDAGGFYDQCRDEKTVAGYEYDAAVLRHGRYSKEAQRALRAYESASYVGD